MSDHSLEDSEPSPEYTPEERDAWDRYLEGQGPDPSGEKTPGKSIAEPSPQVSPEIIPPTALSSQESGPESFAPAANPKPEEPEASRAPPKNQSKPRKRDPAYVLQDILGPPEAKFVPGEQNDGEEPEEALAPEALHPALSETCFYGPLGEITNAVAPYTEADPAAILIQLLIAFGNLIGSSPHFWVGSDCHYTNLFACVVGRTSKARKGMSLGYVREGFKIIEPAWISGCLRSGTSSGEGIIWAVRDPITKNEPVKEKGKFTGQYVEVITDRGMEDKRLCLVENEFARALAAMNRDHNTLSAVLRDAWDHHNLDTLVKHDPGRAHGAHISIVTHITRKELFYRLKEYEFFNGFANRFLWLCAQRANYLPEPPSFADLGLSSYFEHLKEVALQASQICEMERSEAARQIWCQGYRELSAGGEGKFGAATDRSEAQVTRLSMIYALSTGSRIIDVQAQEAALAMWKYCEDSARYLFDDTLTSPKAKRLLAVWRARPEGMTRREINDLVYKRNVPSRVITEVLESLKGLGVLICHPETTGGRAAERWVIRNNRIPGATN
jgi:hypothetical protein